MLAYHFIQPDLKTRFDNKQAVVGEWLEVDGKLELCQRGLHASVHPWDAASYAEQNQTTLCFVELGGEIIEGEDKVCARRRKILKMIDATPLLRQIAIFAAELVLPIYEKAFPNDARVRDCIETTKRFLVGTATKEDLAISRAAAYVAARAADDAAYWAACAAAYAAAAWAAACAAAAWAADDAAHAAADAAAAWAAACAAAAWAADDAAHAAADAAHAAACAAAYAAARDKTRQTIRDEFKRLVDEAFSKV